MPGMYILSSGGVTIPNQACTLVWVNPPAAPNADLILHRFWVGQSNNMASAQQRVQLNTQVTAFPSMVSATPAKLSNISAASILTGNTTGAAGTCGIAATGEAAGAKTVVWSDVFNVVNGWLLVCTPDEYIEMGAGSANGLGLHLPVAPGTLTNWSFGETWMED